MAPHSSTLAWKIPWTEEPGGLQSMRSLRVRHDWATSLSLFTFHFHALEKEMATQASVLAWRIPGTEEPGGLPSMGSHRVGYDWSDLAAAAAYINDTMQYLPFCLASFRIMPSGFIYFVAKGSISFSWLNNFLVCCVCLHVCRVFLSIYPPVDTLDTEVISMSWLLWIMRHWTQGCGYLFEILFSLPLAIYPEK